MKKTKFEAAPLSAHIQAGAIMRLLHEYTVASVMALEDISTQKEIAKMRSIIRNVEELQSVYDAKLHQVYGDKITVGDDINSPTRHIFYGDLTSPPEELYRRASAKLCHNPRSNPAGTTQNRRRNTTKTVKSGRGVAMTPKM